MSEIWGVRGWRQAHRTEPEGPLSSTEHGETEASPGEAGGAPGGGRGWASHPSHLRIIPFVTAKCNLHQGDALSTVECLESPSVSRLKR